MRSDFSRSCEDLGLGDLWTSLQGVSEPEKLEEPGSDDHQRNDRPGPYYGICNDLFIEWPEILE